MNEQQKKWFLEIHSDLPREGPGDCESTKKAFSLMKGLPRRPQILDIGCGPGKQTLDLIEVTDGNIIAIDNHHSYIDRLNEEVAAKGLDDRIQAMYGDMLNLEFSSKSFDAIWSEGAIYIIGFERGLEILRPFLKENGYIAVTELCWLQSNPPVELKDYWAKEYPEMLNIESSLAVIKNSGYTIVDCFELPENAWWDDYYNPLQRRINMLKEKYRNSKDAIQVINAEQSEIDLYRQYSEYYGYVFYVMQCTNIH